MLQQLANILVPLFICIAVGWGWARAGQAFDTAGIAGLVTLIGAPCLVFHTLLAIELETVLLAQVGLATLVLLVGFAVVGSVALRVTGLSQLTYLPPLLFPNIGNVGLPLCLFAFGQEGLALAVVVFAVMVVFNFTVGIWMYSGSRSPVPALLSPIVHATWIALALRLSETAVPDALLETARLLGEFTIPVMLLTLGVSLARLRVAALWRSLWLSCLRIGMGVVLGTALAALFRFEGVVKGVFILQASMPVAVFTYLFAVRYQRAPEEAAGLVVVSTLLSMLTLPLLLAWLIP
jgi:malate permease and related proteins